jgi:hypothetical protein
MVLPSDASFSKSATLDVDSRSRSGSILLYFFLATAPVLFFFGSVQLVKYHEISKGIALLGSGLLALLSVATLFFPAQFSAAAIVKWCTAAVALLWSGWSTLIAYAHHIDGWDEGAYLLSGMALRGYDVPYASHRPPVTGVVCALFIGWDRYLNPVLLGVLLIMMYLWVRRLLGPPAAMVALFALFCQNLLLESTVDIMSELPATVLLFAGFFALARERFWWSALWFGLVLFARWNLAPVWWVVLLAVFVRFGLRQSLKFLTVALTIFVAWYMLTIAMGAPKPVLRVIEGNLLAGPAWRPDQTNHFLLLVRFYGTNFFFLTPPVLLALLLNPLLNLRKQLRTELWIPLVVMPLALLAYLGAMLLFGGPFARFMVPVIPLGIVSLLVGLSSFSDDRLLSTHSRMSLAATALFVTCAVGLWPLSALVHARINLNDRGVFSADLRKELHSLNRTTPLYGVPREPLCSVNGNPAMVEARHRILFPSARRDDFTHNYIEEPDSVECVRRLVAACHSGDLMLIPAKYTSDVQYAALLFSDNQWALMRKP